MSSTLAGAFGIAALLVAVLALVFAIQSLRRQSDPPEPPLPPTPQPPRPVPASQLPDSKALQHLAVVRYDAFGEMGGKLSWSMALLDDNGDGVVLTAINSRNDARSYAKEVRSFSSDAKLSPEEEEALETARKQADPAD